LVGSDEDADGFRDAADQSWRLDVSDFPFQSRTDLRGLSKNVANFYLVQNELIARYKHLEEMHSLKAHERRHVESLTSDHWSVNALVTTSFVLNVLLLVGKLFATIVSGSLAVLASLLDSFLDLLSGSILFLVQRAMRRSNQYQFPAGKSRLEPLGIIVFASVMFTATSVVIIESIKSLIQASAVEGLTPLLGGILAFVVVSKLILFILCWLVLRTRNSPTLEALMQDHRNDFLTNSFGVGMVLLAFYVPAAWFMDAAGAILMSAYVMVTWVRTGWHHVEMLSGKTASPQFLSQLTFLCWNHSAKMVAIDTVRAFHLSFGFLVEVDIVLPEEMTLREAHDIGEALQWKIEALPEVERAFVHLDYEVDHKPEHVTAHRPDWSHNSVSIEPASPDTSPSARPRRRLKTARNAAAAAAAASATTAASTASAALVPTLDSAESELPSRKNTK
jgi:cation diffusion facilitator family transporter